MIEESVRALQFIQVFHHLVGCTVYVLTVSRYTVSPGLYNGYHVHIINPHTCLPCIAVACQPFLALLGILRQFPLGIGIGQTHLLVTFILIYLVKHQWQ